MNLNKAVLALLVFLIGHNLALAQIYNGTGTVSFVSVAPLETIKASSDKLKGLLDLDNHTFAFVLPVQSFEGFNSPLQQEHFNERYLESKKYPKSEFSGKMIGMKNCSEPCKQIIYAKGKLNLHGVTRVRTIRVIIEQKDNKTTASADFKVPLYDFEITLPKLLESKIATDISVQVKVVFTEKDE